MKTAGEIEEFVTQFNNRYSDLRVRMDSDHDNLWSMAKYSLDKWSENVTFNEGRVFADAVLQTIDSARLSISIHREDGDPEKEWKGEKFAHSCFHNADDRLMSMLMPQLKSSLGFFGGVRGFMAGRIFYYEKDGKPCVDILPYDPRYLAWSFDSDGIIEAAYESWRDGSSVRGEYGEDVTKDDRDVHVIEYISKDEYTVVVQNEIVTPESERKLELGYAPVLIIPCGSTPLIAGSEGYRNWGESFYAGGRTLYEPINKILTVMMSVAMKSHKPGGFVKLPDPKLKVPMPWGTGEMTTLPLEAEVQIMEPPEVARTNREIYEILSQALQRSNFPYLRYGQTWKGQEWSGAALDKMLSGPEKTLNPLFTAMSRFYKGAIQMLFSQYLNYGTKFTAMGRDNTGELFRQPIEPGDIEGNFDVEVEMVSITPEEDANNYAKAQMIKQDGLAPDSFINEKIIKFQNYQGIELKKRVDEAEVLDPTIKLVRTIEALINDGKNDEAEILRAQLAKVVMDMRMTGIKPPDVLMSLVEDMLQPQMGPPGVQPPPQPESPPMTEQEVGERLASVGGM